MEKSNAYTRIMKSKKNMLACMSFIDNLLVLFWMKFHDITEPDPSLFVCVVFNGTSAQKGNKCQESVKIKLVEKRKDSEHKC